MPETICVRGRVKRGNTCWRLEMEGSETLFLVGDLSKVRDGDVVTACGSIAEASFCGGRALAVSFIGKSIQGEDALPTSATRDIEVSATASERDSSPIFRLEQRTVSLRPSAGEWRVNAKGVHVEGKLDVFFNSKGFRNQKFTVTVTATDPTNGAKIWTEKFTKFVEKDHVVFDEKMDVGAVDPTAGVVNA